MWEFRFFWNKWRIAYDHVVYKDDPSGIYVVYLGPFVIARHYLDR